jgi:hypothetical protein
MAPVQATALVRWPTGRHAVKPVANAVGVDRKGAELNREGGVAATRQRTCMVKAGLRPHLTETPRQRTTTPRGRKRLFKDAIQA